jgi:hypothetical protein
VPFSLIPKLHSCNQQFERNNTGAKPVIIKAVKKIIEFNPLLVIFLPKKTSINKTMFMLPTIKPGQMVKHYANAIHYGLQMEVIDIQGETVQVAFINLDGMYEELWVNGAELDLFAKEDVPQIISHS